jgi:tetratricopeptide (TPR) repeat protein
VPWIRQTVSLRFTYWVISTITDRLIATKSFYKTNKHQVKEEYAETLKSPIQLYREILNGNLQTMARQLAPYEVWEARIMMKDKTKDPRMEEADNLVKGNIYDKALDLFLEIWYDNQNPAAGVNAAIMHEVLGDIDSALVLIENVLDVNADPKVMSEYKRLQRVKEDLSRLEKQLEES